MPSIHHYGPKLVPTIMHYILQCNILLLLTYAPTIGLSGAAHKEISRGKSFILSGKVTEK